MLDVNVGLGDLKKYSPYVSYSIGGKGYNVAHTLRLFDVPTILATMYGQDEIGRYLKERIARCGIEMPLTNVVNYSSSIFVGVHDKTGETVFDKADVSIFDIQKIPKVNYRNVSIVLILSSTAPKILDHLRAIKVKNPKILFCLEISGKKTIEGILPYLDMFSFLVCNRKEAEELGIATNMDNDLEKIICAFLQGGMQEVIITTDKDGIVGGKLQDNIPIIYRSSVRKIAGNVISTVGAGDSVTASFIASYYYFHKEFQESLDIAMYVASLTVRTKDPFPKRLPQNLLSLKQKNEIF